MGPQTRYCTSADGTRIAFTVTGTGPGIPLVFVHGWAVANDWLYGRPDFLAQTMQVAATHMTVYPEWRGVGSSEREVTDLSLDAHVADLTAVVDALALPRFALGGAGAGAAVAVAFAVRHPERVDRMDLMDLAVHIGEWRPGGRMGTDLIRSDWSMARRILAGGAFPAGPVEAQREYSRMLRENMSPDVAARYFEFYAGVDLHDLLRRIAVPTLVETHRRPADLDRARAAAALIPGVSLIQIEGVGGLYFDSDGTQRKLEWLGDSTEHVADAARSGLRTVLFTDLVGHTEMMQRLGDERGRDVLREHERITRETLRAHGGAEVKTMGDGFLASFASVTKAIDCAIALQRAFDARNHVGAQPAAPAGEPLHVRVGLNAGEPIEEDGDLFGATVILASRICAQAGAGEILIPEPLRHLLSGKSYVYADRGETMLKGFEDAVRLYEVRWRERVR